MRVAASIGGQSPSSCAKQSSHVNYVGWPKIAWYVNPFQPYTLPLVQFPNLMTNPIVFMDLQVGNQILGRVEFQLYRSACPKTAENFRALCTGEFEQRASTGHLLHYKGHAFHRIIPGFMIQGGDFTSGDGTGGESIYGVKFEDETFAGPCGKHTGFGCLSMANAGPNSNGSQFFICTADTEWLDGKHVVFGTTVSGHEVLKAVEALGSSSGETSQPVIVHDCGQIA